MLHSDSFRSSDLLGMFENLNVEILPKFKNMNFSHLDLDFCVRMLFCNLCTHIMFTWVVSMKFWNCLCCVQRLSPKKGASDKISHPWEWQLVVWLTKHANQTWMIASLAGQTLTREEKVQVKFPSGFCTAYSAAGHLIGSRCEHKLGRVLQRQV